MSSKEAVVELVRRLPDEVSMMDIAREIEFVAGIREARMDGDDDNKSWAVPMTVDKSNRVVSVTLSAARTESEILSDRFCVEDVCRYFTFT